MQRVYLKSGRERPVLNGHPWIFSGAADRTDGDAHTVGVADVFDWKKTWIARGLYNPASQIRVRVLTWKDEPIDGDFFRRRITRALALREKYIAPKANAFRLINGEGDFLPGLVVDRYAEFLVCQFVTAGMEKHKLIIIDVLTEALKGLGAGKGIFERSDGKVREEEGLGPSVGMLAGKEPPELIEVEENGFKFLVDIRRGQKTGFFLDQRDNRQFLTGIARDAAVLNCFSYSGAFSIYALGGGARSVISLDSSRPALEIAEKNLGLNRYAGDHVELIKGDAFAYLKECDASFDMIVLDPPSLAHRRSDIDAATGGYKFLNLHAFRHLNAGGFLLTFSCSQHLSSDLFQKVVFGAAVDAGRRVMTVKKLGPPIDHPVSLHHPEGDYLKGLVLHVLD
ncbi:MAG: class I SAM-dependent rRNA methyltransferase [Candidatus Binatia bacterium]